MTLSLTLPIWAWICIGISLIVLYYIFRVSTALRIMKGIIDNFSKVLPIRYWQSDLDRLINLINNSNVGDSFHEELFILTAVNVHFLNKLTQICDTLGWEYIVYKDFTNLTAGVRFNKLKIN